MRVLSLLIVLTAWCVLTKADKPRNCSKGVIKPEDGYFLDGQDIVLTCWRSNGITPRHLYFTRGARREALSDKYHERNKTHVTLRLPVTADDVANYTGNSMGYYCHDGRSKKDVCIQNVYVEIDYYPRKPVDVKCFSDNWDTMTCTWDLVVDYNHPPDYEVSCQFVATDSTNVDVVAKLLYRLSEDAEFWSECPNQTNSSCHWDKPNYHEGKIYIVKVKVRNTVLNITTSTEELFFKTNDIVKPVPVKLSDIAVSHFDDPETVHVQWNHSESTRDFDFNLKITSKCDPEKVFNISYKPDQSLPHYKQTPAQINITDLNPYTEYTVSLVAKALGGKGPWSEATEIMFTTLSDVPKASPYTRSGLYEEISEKCSTTRHCKRIKVYFEPLTECEMYSNTTEYSVRSPLLNTSIESSKFRAKTEVTANKTSSVELRAFSEEGISTNYSSLRIYPEFERPNIVQDVVLHYNPNTGDCTARVVMLKQDVRFSNISHVIVWCYSAGDLCCKEPIDWYELRPDEAFLMLPMKHCKLKYRIGISTLGRRADKGEVATPIHWESCIYEEGKVPKVPLPHVDIFETGVSRKIKVSWTEYSCNTRDINYVEYYEVSYCGVSEEDHNCTCTEKLVTLNVSKLETSVTLLVNDLGQYGCVWVRAKTVAGFGPKNAEGKPFNVTNSAIFGASSSDAGTGAVIGASVCGGVLVIVLLACLTPWCYKRIKRRLTPPKIDEIPMNESPRNTDIERVRETEMMTEEEVEPLISDSGTGSLVSKISVDNSETEEVKNGSDDSGVHRLGSIGDEEALFALIDGNPAGSGNTYERMPDLDEYDFDTSGGIGTGRSMNSKIELNTVNEGITLADRPDTVNEESEFTIQETSVTEEDPDHCMHIDEASHRRDIGKTLNEATVDVQSNTVVSSHKGCTSCQQTDSDTADAEKHPAIKLAVDKTKAVSEISNQKVVSDQESVICAADLSFNIKSGDSIFTEIQEPKAPGSEDEDLINNESVQMSKSAEFSNHSSILSGRDNFSLDLNVSGASGRGYARASDVSMDSDISDSEPEESKSEIATNDLTHTKNHSSSCTSQNIQLSQEQNIGMSKESNNICDNTSSIPHQQLHGDKGSKLNTISEVSSPVPEGNQQKNEVKTKPNKLSRSGNESYMKVKESKSEVMETGCEPRHDKTNKVTVHPAKTQISLGIRPV